MGAEADFVERFRMRRSLIAVSGLMMVVILALGPLSPVARGKENGQITRLAGTGEWDWGSCGDTPAGTQALSKPVSIPRGVETDSEGNVWILDGCPALRWIDPSGTVHDYVWGNILELLYAPDYGVLYTDASGLWKVQAGGSPELVYATQYAPGHQMTDSDIAVGTSGEIFEATFDGATQKALIRRIDQDGTRTTIAGGKEHCPKGPSSPLPYELGDGGQAAEACFGIIKDLALDSAGNLFVSGGSRVRRIGVDGIVDTFAVGTMYDSDLLPAGFGVGNIEFDGAGNLFMVVGSHWVFKVDASGQVLSRVVGHESSNDPAIVLPPGDEGPATEAFLESISDLSITGDGDVLLTDRDAHVVRRVEGVAFPRGVDPSPSPSPSPTGVPSDCPSVFFYGVRGSGEPRGLGEPNRALFKEMREHFEPGEIKSRSSSYPAAGPDFAVAVDLLSKQVRSRKYTNSVEKGVDVGIADTRKMAKQCPEAKWVLSGYSQGAEVVRGILATLGKLSEHVAAVSLFGDPYFYDDENYVETLGGFKRGRVGIHWEAGGSPTLVAEKYDKRVFSWCHRRDVVCQTFGTLFPHLDYEDDSSEAAELMVPLLSDG